MNLTIVRYRLRSPDLIPSLKHLTVFKNKLLSGLVEADLAPLASEEAEKTYVNKLALEWQWSTFFTPQKG